MTTTVPPHRTPARPNHALRAVLLLLGSLVLIAILVSTGLRVGTYATAQDQSGVHPVTEDVQAVTVKATATNVQVVYGDVDHPQVDYTQGRNDHVLRRHVSGEELNVVVESPGRGIGLFTPTIRGRSDLQITLPRDADGTDLSLRVTAGNVRVDGDFGEVGMDITATVDAELSGSAQSLTLDSTAARVIARDLETTGPVRVDMSAGELRYHGSALPSAIDVSATAADVTFELPAGEYEIRTSTVAGNVSQGLASTAGAERIYEFSTTAGDIELSQRP